MANKRQMEDLEVAHAEGKPEPPIERPRFEQPSKPRAPRPSELLDGQLRKAVEIEASKIS
jgi:hypothetical protein